MIGFLAASTACIVYPPLTALRVHWGISPECLTQGTPMLALADDAALARLVIAATAIPAARVRCGCAISLVRSKTVRRVGRASAVMQRGSAQSFYGTQPPHQRHLAMSPFGA